MNPQQQKLPDMSHISREEWKTIYEPAEDTYLLIDTLHKFFSTTTKVFHTILEVGPGSGIVTKSIQTLLHAQPKANISYLCDISSSACRVCTKTIFNSPFPGEVIQMDLFSSFKQKDFFDLVVFNPPYVVTPSDEVNSIEIAQTWAGGVNGREVIDRFLNGVMEFVSKGGVLFLLVIEDNKPEEVINILRQKGFGSVEVVSRRRAFNELIYILKAEKGS
eukprot:snap_masked-scaffold_2-processed-gene-6.20-mRNA-1 protein AED:0.03 eAED:0.03 QI:0/-1/0/1/-1/1/1/0/218